MALLLNVAANYLRLSDVVSADGATASQAITYCDNLIDNPAGNHELAKNIAELINNGQQVPAGMVPIATPAIAYRSRPVHPTQDPELTLQGALPNPARGSFEVLFSLPDDAPAVIEILDVAGRRISRRDVGGRSGTLSLRVGGDGLHLPVGVYMVRLIHGGTSLVRRVAVID